MFVLSSIRDLINATNYCVFHDESNKTDEVIVFHFFIFGA